LPPETSSAANAPSPSRRSGHWSWLVCPELAHRKRMDQRGGSYLRRVARRSCNEKRSFENVSDRPRAGRHPDSRGHVSGDRASHAMGVSASAWRTTGQHRQLVRRVDPSRIAAVSNARPDTSDATAGAISSLWHLGRVRTPSFRTLKVGSRTEDPRRRQGSPHAVGNVPRRPTQGRSTRAPTLPFLAVVASGRLSLPPSQRSSPSES
jgi:hypothetical protein